MLDQEGSELEADNRLLKSFSSANSVMKGRNKIGTSPGFHYCLKKDPN